MKGSEDSAFKTQLKQLILDETESELTADDVSDDEVLFGPDTTLQLDSIDGLQVSMALQLHYGVRVTDPKELIRIMASINTLADYLRPD